MKEKLYQQDNYLVEKNDSGEINVWEVIYDDKELGIIDLSASTWLYSSGDTIGNLEDLPDKIKSVVLKEII